MSASPSPAVPLHVHQQNLITKLQDGTINDDEGNNLIESFRGITINMAKKYSPSFPGDVIDELIGEGDYALWVSLRKFNHDISAKPSTFSWRLVSTHHNKRWHHNRVRCVKTESEKIDKKTGKKEKIHIANKSLDDLIEEHGDIKELGSTLKKKATVHEELELNEQLDSLCKICENDLLVHRVLTNIIKISSSARRRRPKEVMNQVARELGIKSEEVEDVVTLVGNYLVDGDIVLSLAALEKKLENKFMRGIDVAELMMAKDDMVDAVEIMRWTGSL